MFAHRLSLAVFLAAAPLPAHADGDSRLLSQELARRAVARGEIKPLSDIIDIARRDFSAPLVEVEFEHTQGRYVYELVLLAADGALVELYYDASTGELLAMERQGESLGAPSLFHPEQAGGGESVAAPDGASATVGDFGGDSRSASGDSNARGQDRAGDRDSAPDNDGSRDRDTDRDSGRSDDRDHETDRSDNHDSHNEDD